MSEIPLRIIGRKTNGSVAYASVSNEDSDSLLEENINTNLMTSAVRTTAVSNRTRDKSKQQERYKDEPHESQTLLGEHGEDLDEEDLVVYSEQSHIPSVGLQSIMQFDPDVDVSTDL